MINDIKEETYTSMLQEDVVNLLLETLREEPSSWESDKSYPEYRIHLRDTDIELWVSPNGPIKLFGKYGATFSFWERCKLRMAYNKWRKRHKNIKEENKQYTNLTSAYNELMDRNR